MQSLNERAKDSSTPASGSSGQGQGGSVEARGEDVDYLQLLKETIEPSQRYMQQQVEADWSRAQRAVQNKHSQNSKYYSAGYRNRAKIFKPKTRAAVRKNLTALAAALFSSQDAVSIRARVKALSGP